MARVQRDNTSDTFLIPRVTYRKAPVFFLLFFLVQSTQTHLHSTAWSCKRTAA